MDKIVLIIGSETLLGRKLIELSLNKGNRVIAPVMTSQEKLKESSNKNLRVIPWNRGSLVSSKTVLREAVRSFGRIDTVIVVHPEPKVSTSLPEATIESIDESLNTYIHGSIYLIKELMDYFYSEEKGSLVFAEPERSSEGIFPVSSLIRGGFHSFADAVLLSRIPGIYKCGFLTQITEMDDFGDFILNVLEDSDPRANGEWLKFTEKKGIFQSLPIVKRK